MQECIVSECLCPVEIYGCFLRIYPEVAVLVRRSVSGLRRKLEKEQKTHSRTKTAVTGHDLGISQWLDLHGICHSAAVAVPVVDF